MQGAIICKTSDGNILILCHGEYSSMQNKLASYCKIITDSELKLVNTAGINIDEIKYNQIKVNEQFKKEF